jgi:hypothetical protein
MGLERNTRDPSYTIIATCTTLFPSLECTHLAQPSITPAHSMTSDTRGSHKDPISFKIFTEGSNYFRLEWESDKRVKNAFIGIVVRLL